MDIWSLVKQKLAVNEEKIAKMEKSVDGRNDEEDTGKKRASHLIICGNSQSGKSMMINKFLDKNEEPKETVALEYTYARRTRGNNKDVCHIWELGGGRNHTQLLAIPLTKENIETASLVIVLDLTRPKELWITMETLMADARRYTETAIKNLGENEQTAIRNRIKTSTSMKKENGRTSFFPIPVLIVGTKYDEFQNFDSEQRRRICATLRFIAFYYGAHLIFYSCYHEQLVRIGRSFFSHLAFGSSITKAKVVDHNKPIYVINGTDTVEAIGPPQSDSTTFSHATETIHFWKNTFCEYFPQTERDTAERTNEEQELFREPMIDSLIEQKEKDLQVYIRHVRDHQLAEARLLEKK